MLGSIFQKVASGFLNNEPSKEEIGVDLSILTVDHLKAVISANTDEDMEFFEHLEPQLNEMKVFFQEKEESQQTVSGLQNAQDILSILNDAVSGMKLDDKFEKAKPEDVTSAGSALYEWLKAYCYSNSKSTLDLYMDIEDSLSDGMKYVVNDYEATTTSKGKKKYNNAVQSYAYEAWQEDSPKEVRDNHSLFLLLVDTTLWGSADNGLFITPSEIRWCRLMDDPGRMDISKAKKFEVKGTELCVDGKRIDFVHPEASRYVRKISDMLTKQRAQPGQRLLNYLSAI